MTGTKALVCAATCAAGHKLQLMGRHYTCDACQRTSLPNVLSVSYCCAQCNWDLCPTHVHPAGTITETAPFQWQLEKACPKGHKLQLLPRASNWVCDSCNKQYGMWTVSGWCGTCDYDVCPDHILQQPPPERPRALGPAASLSDVQEALNAVAGPKGFRCVPVSWEDAQRGTVGGALSCWGGNISDVRLWEKGGRMLYTLRTENWNERLGYVSSKGVAVMVGNEKMNGTLTAVTLEKYLREIGTYAGYAGVETSSLYDETVDGLLTIRFQTVFLPVGSEELAKVEFCTEVYNYNTRADDDPRNLLLLATPQGTSVQQDGASAKKVFFHAVDDSGAKRYWLEAERSEEKVGGEQKESEEAAAAAWARGKAVAVRIGTKAMGTRFNVQMLIQLPLKQKPKPPRQQGFGVPGANFYGGGGAGFALPSNAPMMMECCESVPMMMPCPPPSLCSAPQKRKMASKPVVGVSNAARVSRGSQEDVYSGVSNRTPARDPSQHGTITVTMYYTVAGGVPSVSDIEAAINDLDSLYKACPVDKRLVDATEVTSELTVQNMKDIGTKLVTQPYKPASQMPKDTGFPE